MKSGIAGLLTKKEFTRDDIVALLGCDDENSKLLYKQAAYVKEKYIGNTAYLRGLIEYSNICGKNCLFCGTRRDNNRIFRFTLSNDEVIEAAMTASRFGFGSITMQGGEIESPVQAENIEKLIRAIRKINGHELDITLSLGEQLPEVYSRWFEAGAHRYLLRIEASGIDLYNKVHPSDDQHKYFRRLECLRTIQSIGFQTGTGIMTGLPHQTLYNLADDILFMRNFDIDMCEMGPFIEHTETSPGHHGTENFFLQERFKITLRMISILRIIMKDINIIASTSMHEINPGGREMSIMAGANIILSNLTPQRYLERHKLYEQKHAATEMNERNVSGLNHELIPGITIALGKLGDSSHFRKRIAQNKV